MTPVVLALVRNPTFGWFVQWALPGLHVQRQGIAQHISPHVPPHTAQLPTEATLHLLAPDRRSIVVCTSLLKQRLWQAEVAAQDEQETLWPSLLDCYARWRLLRHPAIENYTLWVVQGDRRVLCVDKEILELR